MSKSCFKSFLTIFCLLSVYPTLAEAYVGPGAGFAFVSSFFVLFATFVLAFLTLLTWPIRWAIRAFLRMKRGNKGRVKRVVIVGIDGQDPELTEKFLAEGLLPNFQKLREQGAFKPLQTTLPAESPVAWSTFQTGCNPGKHKIFDFLLPNRKTLLPELSSAHVTASSRILKIGKYRIPLGKPGYEAGRKSKTFWKVAGEYGISSTVLRVPITFPPEEFNGNMLSAMCVPDIKGSQGTYFYFTSNPEEKRRMKSGVMLPLELGDKKAKGMIPGPENALVEGGGEMRIPFEVNLEGDDAELVLNKERYSLKIDEYTPWIQVQYKPGLGMKVWGACRFMLLEKEPHVRIYLTPIMIDPENPALPISYPTAYSMYLAKSQGTFGTLGLAEDTSALNEGIIDEEAFLKQCRSVHLEREAMFFDALEKNTGGSVVCVFDLLDRTQHMFFRFMDKDHPANKGQDVSKYENVIKEFYQKVDELLGRIMEKIEKDNLLMVISDHGFKPFKRGVNLNAWLKEHGYLAVKEGAQEKDMLQAIDWQNTKAYAVGFGGIFINMAGRESFGIVKSGEETKALKQEISEKLRQLHDEAKGENPVTEVYDRDVVYSGPYVKDAPDLIAGFKPGYRAAWRSVTGGIGDAVLEDNAKPWSGDHNMNPPDVPGILFCNRPFDKEKPHIQDIGPTVLDLLGVPIPGYCDGESLFPVKKQQNRQKGEKA